MGRHPMGEGVDPNPRFVAEKLVDQSALVMGMTAENLHDRYPHLTKQRADAYAVRQPGEARRRRTPTARSSPTWCRVATRSGETGWGLATADEPPRPGTTLEDLGRAEDAVPAARPGHRGQRRRPERRRDRLPARRRGRRATSSGCRCRMRLVSYAFAGVEPEVMGVGPIPATEKALAKAGLTIDDIGLFEINEAFAVQVLAFLDHFGIADDDPRVNQYGGAIAVGHPLASSGVRLMTQLARQFEEQPGGPLRPDHHVRRHRHGRHRDLGEPALQGRRRHK